MDKVRSVINDVDAVLGHETEQDGMQARTERVFVEFWPLAALIAGAIIASRPGGLSFPKIPSARVAAT